MKINVRNNGTIQLIYTEDIDILSLGKVKSITRASHLDANGDNQWEADMLPSGGPVLGPFPRRSEALRAEEEWINNNIL